MKAVINAVMSACGGLHVHRLHKDVAEEVLMMRQVGAMGLIVPSSNVPLPLICQCPVIHDSVTKSIRVISQHVLIADTVLNGNFWEYFVIS